MVFVLFSVGLALGLFISMLVFLEVGRRLGVRRLAERGSADSAGVGVVDGAVYGLLALLIGFTFSGAADRFDRRRNLIAEEKNAAETAWLRASIMPTDLQAPVRAHFRQYMDAIIAYYAENPSREVALNESPAMRQARADLWAAAVPVCRRPEEQNACQVFLPALNDMFDAVDMERMTRRIHPPFVIFVMLGVAALATALFAGYGMAGGRKRNVVYMVGIAATVSIAAYVIIELEYPRVGLIRVTAMDQVLVELRESMD
jgi:hypothetical protein